MRWRDSTKEEPPDGVRVLVCDAYGDIKFGHYCREASASKGSRLPNPRAEAVWLISDVNCWQGLERATHWALVLPPSCADDA